MKCIRCEAYNSGHKLCAVLPNCGGTGNFQDAVWWLTCSHSEGKCSTFKQEENSWSSGHDGIAGTSLKSSTWLNMHKKTRSFSLINLKARVVHETFGVATWEKVIFLTLHFFLVKERNFKLFFFKSSWMLIYKYTSVQHFKEPSEDKE